LVPRTVSRSQGSEGQPRATCPSPRPLSSPPHTQPSPDSSAKPSGPRAMVANRFKHGARAGDSRAREPCPVLASSSGGSRRGSSGSHSPGFAQQLTSLRHQLFLPGRGSPACPRPGPRCHQRLPPATGPHAAQTLSCPRQEGTARGTGHSMSGTRGWGDTSAAGQDGTVGVCGNLWSPRPPHLSLYTS
jgi:hypothetical protein